MCLLGLILETFGITFASFPVPWLLWDLFLWYGACWGALQCLWDVLLMFLVTFLRFSDSRYDSDLDSDSDSDYISRFIGQ